MLDPHPRTPLAGTDRLPDPYRAEAAVLADRLAALGGALDWATVQACARPWVRAVRENPPPFWAMERLLTEYPISSHEGLALMRLAEALLRVPDTETAIALTADQLGRADFEGASDAVIARLSSAAIALSKRWLPAEGEAPGLVARLGARSVVAATLRAVQLLGRQFVLGEDIDDALRRAEAGRRAHPAVRHSFDMLGEGARTESDAAHYLQSYRQALEAIARRADPMRHPSLNDGLSIKLSALHPRYEPAQRERVMNELVPRVWTLCERAAQASLNLTIDAEEVERLELSLDVFEALASRVAREYPLWEGLGLALQAYQTRAVELIDEVAAIARRHGVRLMCRLVKGAYWDSEIKRSQELGLPGYPVFTRKHRTDVSYLACARALLDADDVVFAQFATHNAGTIAAVLHMARQRGHTRFELQRLHGMGEGVYREVLRESDVGCRVYAPVGAHRDLLAYLVRR
ncbi:MAG TPA: proline dehydrogenase family protein, partial [Hydrogenophaga sp.]|uniref:proline dehydrogenase family protein n=1 Tax=Hydrogenophaga sp. TaxID=1904254 RepID=UPI002C1F7DCB